MAKMDTQALAWMKKFLRYTDYIGAAQLYLKDNFLLEQQVKNSDFKLRVLGHWGTVPGLNLIYANLNYLICKHKANVLFITGPGHGAPANLANLYAEGTLKDVYKDFTMDAKGLGKLIHDFSWPHSLFPSHVTPTVPGSILEGGELGYSLSTAFGAVFDNPDLIAAVVVGDGEAETGPIAAAWHSNKFLNPRTSGAVLPIVHINGYKISNPTLYGTMSDEELTQLFKGYGYVPLIVKGNDLESKMMLAMEKAYQMIKSTQKAARSRAGLKGKPKWPVILLRSPKGWKGVKNFKGQMIEGSFRAHGVPIDNPSKDPEAMKAIVDWLKSYNVTELLDKKGGPSKELMQFVPKGKYRMGLNKHAVGGNLLKNLKFPRLASYEVKFKKRGEVWASSMIEGSKFLRDVFKKNKDNFRMFCPDELESNQLKELFKATKRAYMWPLKNSDENLSETGMVMEMLSEHTLQGWYQGYLLTGRHGIFVSYEAFATIINSMVDQYAKFIKQHKRVAWRKPVSGAIYLLSSLGWRQDHNGFSHQNPSFVSSVLMKHGKFSQIYYPADANSFLAALEETMKRKDSISVIVAGKRPLPQWLSLKEAREQAQKGIGIWEWVGGKEASKNPDVVLASAGDYLTQEAMFAVKLCKELVPELKLRYVNVSEITSIGLGDYCDEEAGTCLTQAGINNYFTADKPVVFNYHGYVNDIKQLLWVHTNSSRFLLKGYKEEGSTTTPFDMKVANEVSCYHIAMDLISQAAKVNKKVAAKKSALLKQLKARLDMHQRYICENGDDPKDVKDLKW